jgi:hypothetical protein
MICQELKQEKTQRLRDYYREKNQMLLRRPGFLIEEAAVQKVSVSVGLQGS